MKYQVKATGKQFCDFCKEEGTEELATFDGKTCFGTLAFMCNKHYKVYGVGLGLGRGQKIAYKTLDNYIR